MRFWDTSAIVPLVLDEEGTEHVLPIAFQDREPVVWWSTPVEVEAALRRAWRLGRIDHADLHAVGHNVAAFYEKVLEIAAGEAVRRQATRLLRVHDLRAADALQLAAAMVWCGGRPEGEGFVSLDRRLRTAAELEGFTVLPADGPALV